MELPAGTVGGLLPESSTFLNKMIANTNNYCSFSTENEYAIDINIGGGDAHTTCGLELLVYGNTVPCKVLISLFNTPTSIILKVFKCGNITMGLTVSAYSMNGKLYIHFGKTTSLTYFCKLYGYSVPGFSKMVGSIPEGVYKLTSLTI